MSVEGGGTNIRYQDFQAAAGGGGRLGDEQGAVSSHNFLPAHIDSHRGGIRDAEETEPASGFNRVQTLVKQRELELHHVHPEAGVKHHVVTFLSG